MKAILLDNRCETDLIGSVCFVAHFKDFFVKKNLNLKFNLSYEHSSTTQRP